MKKTDLSLGDINWAIRACSSSSSQQDTLRHYLGLLSERTGYSTKPDDKRYC